MQISDPTSGTKLLKNSWRGHAAGTSSAVGPTVRGVSTAASAVAARPSDVKVSNYDEVSPDSMLGPKKCGSGSDAFFLTACMHKQLMLQLEPRNVPASAGEATASGGGVPGVEVSLPGLLFGFWFRLWASCFCWVVMGRWIGGAKILSPL